MKKILYLMIVLCFSQIAKAQDFDKMLANLRKTSRVEHVKLSGFWFNLAKSFALPNLGEEYSALKNIKGLEVISMDDCSSADRKKGVKWIEKALKDPKYEKMISVKDEKSFTYILTRTKEDRIKELVIIDVEDDKPNIVKISGDLSMDEIQKLTESKKKD